MRVIVCGSRAWTDPEPIRRELLSVFNVALSDFQLCSSALSLDEMEEWAAKTITLVHGDARGADKMAGEIAAKGGFEVIPVPAQWEKYGKAAGPKRNERMLREFGPIDLVIAFHEDLAKSRGTKDMVNRAIRDGIKVVIVSKPRQPGYGSKLARTLSA